MTDFYHVDVVIPTFNSSEYISRALDSAINQSGNVILNILVFDDCSTDETKDILKKYEESYANIQVFYSTKNIGAGSARQKLLMHCQGDFIAFLDSDDVWSEGKIVTQIQFMNKHGIDLCITNFTQTNANTQTCVNLSPKKIIVLKDMFLKNHIPMSAAIFRTSLNYQSCMTDLRKRQDYAFWIKLFKKNPRLKCMTLPKEFTHIYKTENSISNNKFENIKYNYLMFHKILGYSRWKAVVFVIFNIVTKLTRL